METLRLQSGKLSFDVFGNHHQETVFFCHSLGANRSLWNRQTERMSQKYKVVRIDLRGHGQSDLFETPYSIKTLAADIIVLLDFLKIQKCHFVGLSLGSMIGLWLAVNRPERFNKMVLAGASSNVREKKPFDERIASIRQKGLAPIMDQLNSRWYYSNFVSKNPNIVEKINAMVTQTSVDGYIAATIAVRDFDLSAQLKKISTPILLITGSGDQATPLSEAEYIAAKSDKATLSIVERASHLAIVEKPSEFDGLLYDFLDNK